MTFLDDVLNQPCPPHLQARPAPGEDPIEAARRYRVDIEHLRAFAALTPDELLDYLQSMADFVVAMRALRSRSTDEQAR